jgi:WD40 repeat protein
MSRTCGLTLLLAFLLSAGTSGQEAIRKSAPQIDLSGDPLPEGAIARLGSLRFHHVGGILGAAFAPDSQSILVVGHASKELSLRFWDTASGKEVFHFEPEQPKVAESFRAAEFAPDGQTVAVCREQAIDLYERKSGKRVRTFEVKGREGTSEIISFAFSPDGKLLAAGCLEPKDENAIRVWEIGTGVELVRFASPGVNLNSVTFSADGKKLFSRPTANPSLLRAFTRAGVPYALCVWDVATRRKLREIDSPSGWIAFAPDGEIVAQQENGIHLMSTSTGKTICRIEGDHPYFAFAPNGKTLVSLDEGMKLRQWDAMTGKGIRHFDGQLGPQSRLLGFSPDGKRIAVVVGGKQKNGAIRLWELATGEEIPFFTGHEADVTHLAYASDGKTLASASMDQTVRLWDPASGKQLRVLHGHRGTVFAVAFAPDGKTLASSSADGTTRLWDIDSGREVASFEQPHFGRAQLGAALSFAPDHKTLTAVGSDGKLAAWDWREQKEINRLELDKPPFAVAGFRPHPPFIPSAVFVTNPAAILTLSCEGWERLDAQDSLYLWDPATAKLLRAIPVREVKEKISTTSCAALAATTDGRLLGASQVSLFPGLHYRDPALRLWERATGKEVLRMAGTIANALAFSPDGKLLAADHGGIDRESGAVRFGTTINLWDTFSGKSQGTLSGHAAQIHTISFTPDGKTLASGSADHTILIWKTPAPKQPDRGVQPTAKRLQAWWDELAGADAARAHQAAGELVLASTPAVRFIREKLQSPDVDPARLAVLIKDLDSTRFAAREKAIRELAGMEEFAEPALLRALKAAPSLETRRRIEHLLERIPELTPRQLQRLRALTVVERIGTPEAREALGVLARGEPEARLTREAQDCLQRLKPRLP